MAYFVVGQAESLASFQVSSGIVAMLPVGSPGGTLGDQAGIIKQGGTVLGVLFGVVQVWGKGDSHLLTGLKEQGIFNSLL